MMSVLHMVECHSSFGSCDASCCVFMLAFLVGMWSFVVLIWFGVVVLVVVLVVLAHGVAVVGVVVFGGVVVVTFGCVSSWVRLSRCLVGFFFVCYV